MASCSRGAPRATTRLGLPRRGAARASLIRGRSSDHVHVGRFYLQPEHGRCRLASLWSGSMIGPSSSGSMISDGSSAAVTLA